MALLVALGAGWAWGASGRSDLNHALRIAELRDGLLEVRAAVLDRSNISRGPAIRLTKSNSDTILERRPLRGPL